MAPEPGRARGEPLLAGVLDEARGRGFVGREEQVGDFERMLRGEAEARVLFLHGPGGIGKTALLDALARTAEQQSRTTVYLDARDVACSAAAVAEAIDSRAGEGVPEVLLLDGYELLAPLDRWFRDELLAGRPARSVTVVAGRDAPSDQWQLDPGWRRLVVVHELAGLAPAESAELLTLHGVDADQVGALARLGRGHPLALGLLAEACADGPVPAQLADDPDVVARLCRLIVDDVPDAAHRTGLATCAHATRMTHDLLTDTVGERADEVWRWLESRPYVRRGAVGLFLHDLVREVFEAEFAQRSPDAAVDLHRRVRDHFLARIFDPREPHPDRMAAEVLLLHRRTPLATQVAGLRDGGLPSIGRAEPAQRAEFLRLVEAGEGPESAALADRWLRRQPHGLYCSRSVGGVSGYSLQVYLPVGGDLEDDDPVVAAVHRAVAAHGPLRPGERINVNRFAGTSEDYQRHPMNLLVNGVACILEWAVEPAAWTFIASLEAELYGPYFEALGMSPMFELDYYGRPLVGFGWDRRRFPATGLFELMARRELSGESGPPPASMMRPAPMSADAFADAVHEALRQLGRPDRLAGSALLGTALVDLAAPQPVEALRLALTESIAELANEPKGPDQRRVLERTYLKGAPSQEAAAELLGLPFSTYRRHLARAEARLVDRLWAVEIGVRRPPGAPQIEQEPGRK